jgi:Flp pilus assembly protein TadG
MRFAFVRFLTEMRSMLVTCQRGQVALIFALAVVMLVIAIGMGIDLWQAYATKARLQSALDAAALAIASTDRQLYSQAALTQRVQDYFAANYPTSALGTPGLPPGTPGPATPTMGPTTACDGTPVGNIVNVCGSAWVPTTFMRIIGVDNLSVTTVGQAQASAPYINFYLLLDSSPSMAIAATPTGVSTMVANTSAQSGCGFACHEYNPSADSLGNPAMASSATCNPPIGYPSGGEDNYALARCLGVTLRIDTLQQAVSDLMTTAQNSETTNNIADEYQMAIYTFDLNFNTIQTMTSNLSTAASAAINNIQMLEVYSNNVKLNTVLVTTGKTTNGSQTLSNLASTTGLAVGQVVIGAGIPQGATVSAKSGSSVTLSSAATATATGVSVTFGTTTNNSDADTNYLNAMTQMYHLMPIPGEGTGAPGDTPREILFFVTDGVDDEAVASCPTAGAQPYVVCSGNRQQAAMDPTTCGYIKGNNIMIAVLYTEYDALPTNTWYMDNVSPYNQPAPPASPDLTTDHTTGIASQLFNCATTLPNGTTLYTKVASGGDISGALSQLFTTAVNAVFLSQ